MQSIAPDVIGGFNAFLAAQQHFARCRSSRMPTELLTGSTW